MNAAQRIECQRLGPGAEVPIIGRPEPGSEMPRYVRWATDEGRIYEISEAGESVLSAPRSDREEISHAA